MESLIETRKPVPVGGSGNITLSAPSITVMLAVCGCVGSCNRKKLDSTFLQVRSLPCDTVFAERAWLALRVSEETCAGLHPP